MFLIKSIPSILKYNLSENLNYKINSQNNIKLNFSLGNNYLYLFNLLIDYYLNTYLLNRSNIHSRKASIIIAQIIDTGHFSKRTVYLSTTQIGYLRNKLKLTNYFQKYLNNNLTTVNINTSIIQQSWPHPLDFNFTKQNISFGNKIRNHKFLQTYQSSEILLVQLLQLFWVSKQHRQKLRLTTKFEIKPYFQKYFRNSRNVFLAQKNNFFKVSKFARVNKSYIVNFLWQKKKNVLTT